MSEAPHWPGADGSPGLDFSSDRSRSGDGLYRGGSGSGGSVDVASPATPDRDTGDASENESTTVSAPKARTQSAVEWATRPLGANATPAKAPVRVAPDERSRTPSSAASAGAVPRPRVGSRRTRKARLRLARIDPWSVMKTTFLFSIAFGVMLIVIVSVLWSVIAGSGALESINQFMTTLVGDQTPDGQFRIETYISGSRILGFAALVAAIDVVIITAVSTLFAFLYNLSATIMGGLEVTLAED